MINKKIKILRRVLIFWTLFIGIGAIAGSTGMLMDPTGKAMMMDKMLPYFQVLPFAKILFQDYRFSGIMLLIVNGLTNLTAATFLFFKKKVGVILGTTFGFTLMLWIIIQFVIFPFNFMSTIYFIFGVLQLITGLLLLIRIKQSTFVFNISNYKNINKNKNNIVMYYSRDGYSKKLAYNEANKIGAYIYEIKAKEKTNGDKGFMWCGRFAMHRWGMKIEDINIKYKEYNNFIIVCPIWVFSICSPIREFAKLSKDKINNVSYIFTHFMKYNFKKPKEELDKLLNVKSSDYKNISIRFGVIK